MRQIYIVYFKHWKKYNIKWHIQATVKSIEIKHYICSKLCSKITWFPLSLPMLYFNAADIQEQFTGAPLKSFSEKFRKRH